MALNLQKEEMFWKKSNNKQSQESRDLLLSNGAMQSYFISELDPALLDLFEKREKTVGTDERFSNWCKLTENLSKDSVHTLAEEKALLEYYISLWGLLRNEELHVKVDFNFADPSMKVHALICFPLVQNALTNGYNTMPAHPIKIRLSSSGNQIKLEVSNHVNHYLKDQSENDYINNLQYRLKFHYPDKHSLFLNSNSMLFKGVMILDVRH